uniref:SAM domain-containing protein n=1 Tax=Panagrolaimus sp. ES5 TaxID=591445 RepID=A0AC34GHI2_9BILA
MSANPFPQQLEDVEAVDETEPCGSHHAADDDPTNPLVFVKKLQLNMNRVKFWTINDVNNLIKLILPTMDDQVQVFVSQQIDGESLLLLTPQDMKEFGMLFGAIVKIRKFVQFLNLEMQK